MFNILDLLTSDESEVSEISKNYDLLLSSCLKVGGLSCFGQISENEFSLDDWMMF